MNVTRVEYEDRIEWKNEKGQWHREDGPAVEYASGSTFWYINGECHREDGPAVEYATGTKSWYINGERHSKEDWEKEVMRIKLKHLSEL